MELVPAHDCFPTCVCVGCCCCCLCVRVTFFCNTHTRTLHICLLFLLLQVPAQAERPTPAWWPWWAHGICRMLTCLFDASARAFFIIGIVFAMLMKLIAHCKVLMQDGALKLMEDISIAGISGHAGVYCKSGKHRCATPCLQQRVWIEILNPEPVDLPMTLIAIAGVSCVLNCWIAVCLCDVLMFCCYLAGPGQVKDFGECRCCKLVLPWDPCCSSPFGRWVASALRGNGSLAHSGFWGLGLWGFNCSSGLMPCVGFNFKP